jgi:hypothetical protein
VFLTRFGAAAGFANGASVRLRLARLMSAVLGGSRASGLRHLGSGRTATPAVLDYFFAQDNDFIRRLDTNAHLIAVYAEHSEANVVVDYQGFICSTA